jgi:uncharacterized protein YdaU (DUF1376 family)
MSKIAVPGGEGKGSLPYHKRWHSDMIAEVINLNLRERGALFTLVDLMYIHGGSVPDEDDFMRRYLGCNAKGWHTLRDRLLHLQKIYRDGNRLLRSPLVDKELKSIRKMRDANAMAGMISQAKRQMTSKVVRESQKISNFSGEKPLKTLESVSTPVQPLQTPYSRYKEEREEAPPSPPFANGAVVAEGKESSETKIIVSNFLAKQIQRKWRQ